MNHMGGKELMQQIIEQYEEQKPFIPNPEKVENVEEIVDLLEELFSTKKVFVMDHPLRSGALIVGIVLPNIILSETAEIKVMNYIAGKADVVEYHLTKDGIALLCTVNDAFVERGKYQAGLN